MKIVSRYCRDKVLYEGPIEDLFGEHLRGANMRRANLPGADLSGADLSGADLSGADLSGADLSGANLFGANLSGADLYGAKLCGAKLRGAKLRGAKLRGAVMNWQSHDLIAEVLRQAAGADPQRRAFAALVLVSPDWCWSKWAGLAQEFPDVGDWALSVLRPLVKDGDGAPRQLRKIAQTHYDLDPDVVSERVHKEPGRARAARTGKRRK